MPNNLKIARKPKIEAPAKLGIEPATNGTTNGISTTDDAMATGTKRKRDMEEHPADPGSTQKLRKVDANSKDHSTNGASSVFIEDSTDGAIVIDDD